MYCFMFLANYFSHLLEAQLPYLAMYNAHFFPQSFEGKIRMHIIHGCNNYIHGCNNRTNNSMYNVHKNMPAHYTQQNILQQHICLKVNLKIALTNN